ncbi:MAG: ABC transporter substrate-binding protein [Eubacteriaceae bacterium]|nr:ABC transporter substrate-binding protein [Eubacteriaceae bacterium]
MKKKGIILFAIFMIAAGVFAGCTSKSGSSSDSKTVTLTVGATPVPHAEILEFIKPLLAEKNIELKIVEFTDYVAPNNALQNKELDANFFQHVPYLDDFNAKNNTDLTAIIPVHFEPLGIYAGKTKSLDEVKDGDTVAVPNDTTNEARALLLLETAGLIKVKEDAGFNATVKDIVSNPKNLKFIEVEAAKVPTSVPDVNIAVINGNYAIEAGFNTSDALLSEEKDSIAAKTYANVVVIRTGDDRAVFDTLKEVIQSEDVKNFIEEKYKGAVVPAF